MQRQQVPCDYLEMMGVDLLKFLLRSGYTVIIATVTILFLTINTVILATRNKIIFQKTFYFDVYIQVNYINYQVKTPEYLCKKQR